MSLPMHTQELGGEQWFFLEDMSECHEEAALSKEHQSKMHESETISRMS